MRNALIVLAFALFICATTALAATINVPADQPTIQAGIDAAVNGDTVLVAPGTYFENINFNGKAITVKSSGGPKVTIIDGGNVSSVATFKSGEILKSVLMGFTLQNGLGVTSPLTEGGGVEIVNSSPFIIGNIITHNVACDGGGIAISSGAAPNIEQNLITHNSGGNCAGLGGAGIYVLGGGTFRIVRNTISNNSQCCADGGGIYMNGAVGSPLISGNIIEGNSSGGIGGGIQAYNQVDANVVQNVFARNTAGSGAGVNWSIPGNTRGPYLINNTFFDNKNTQTCELCQGSALYIEGFYMTSVLENNLFIGYADQSALYCDATYSGTVPIVISNDAYSGQGSGFAGGCNVSQGTNGNISVDPLFVDQNHMNFELTVGSPAIDAGDNSAPDLPKRDLAGKPRIVDGNGDGNAIIDMGPYEFQPQ